jgi:hypothetical protein
MNSTSVFHSLGDATKDFARSFMYTPGVHVALFPYDRYLGAFDEDELQ